VVIEVAAPEALLLLFIYPAARVDRHLCDRYSSVVSSTARGAQS